MDSPRISWSMPNSKALILTVTPTPWTRAEKCQNLRGVKFLQQTFLPKPWGVFLWHHRQQTAMSASQTSSKQTRETNMTVKQIFRRSRKHELSRPDKWLMLVGHQVICYWGPRGNPETPRRSGFNQETAQLWMFLHRDKPFGCQLPVTNFGRRKMVKRSWVEHVCKAEVNMYIYIIDVKIFNKQICQ